MGKRYGISISAGEEKVTLVFSQLTFRDRNRITQASTSYKGGKVVLDMGLSCFYTLKYGLKEIKGFQNDKGEPYKLEFEKGTPELTDQCVDEILSCNIFFRVRRPTDPLPQQFFGSARHLAPSDILLTSIFSPKDQPNWKNHRKKMISCHNFKWL